MSCCYPSDSGPVVVSHLTWVCTGGQSGRKQGIQLSLFPFSEGRNGYVSWPEVRARQAPKQRPCKRYNAPLYLLLCLAQDGKMLTCSHAILIKHHKTKLNAKSYYFSAELDVMSYSHKNE